MIREAERYEGFNITFNVGEACNLSCRYCYEVHKNPSKLTFETARKFIDLILTKTDDLAKALPEKDAALVTSQGLILDFIGGDALMDVVLVERIVNYFIIKSRLLNHRWKDRWRISISTNGTLFGDDKVKRFIDKYHEQLSLGVSIDGCPEIHDKNRIFNDGSGSMNEILKYWDWYKSYYPDPSIKGTLNKDSIPYLYESLVFMHEKMGIQQVQVNFIFEQQDYTEEDLKELDRQLEKCVEYCLKHKDDIYFSLLGKSFADAKSYSENVNEYPNTTFCGGGMMPAISVSGKIYPCFRFLPFALESKIDMNAGDVDSGLRYETFASIRELTRESISPNKCKQCEVESACAWCIAGAFSETGQPYRQTYICEITKLQVKWAKEYWRRFEEADSARITD